MLEKFKISQSSFKAFYCESHKFCAKSWYRKYVLRENYSSDDDTTKAQLMGQVFEYKCIGATVHGATPELPRVGIKNLKPSLSSNKPVLLNYLQDKAPHLIPEIITKESLFAKIKTLPDEWTKGNPSADELAIDEVVEIFRSNEANLGIKNIDIQFSMQTDWARGDVDRRTTQDGKIQLRDLKFATTKYEKEYYNGWSQPGNEAYQRYRLDKGYLQGFVRASTIEERRSYMSKLTFYEKSLIQAVHYLILYNEVYSEWPQFFFDVYGKSGWARIKQVVIDQDTVDNHYLAMDLFFEDLHEFSLFDFDYMPSYDACRTCAYAEKCDYRKDVPEVDITTFAPCN